MGFIDTMRAEGRAVESICRVLREQGCQVAARTYRSWRQPGRRVAARTVTDAQVVDAVRDTAWQPDAKTGEPKLTPEGLYGRRKMTAYLRRTSVPEACLDTARLGDEVIARLTRNQRDNRLFPALRRYTIASQACRGEASP